MSEAHRVPAIDRAIAILDLLGRHREGLSLAGIARECGLTRSTGYRLLGAMEDAGLIRPGRRRGCWALGMRLLGLAAAARASLQAGELVAIARPHLERLSADTGEATKLSVLDQGRAMCVDSVAGSNPYALSPMAAQWFPLHAGAASKILLSALPEVERRAVLAGPLEGYSEHTVTDPALLAEELRKVADEGWAEDRGEHSPSVCALAAPVRDRSGAVIATVSMAYVAERHAAMRRRHLGDLCRCCEAIAADLAAEGGHSSFK